ncbi:hypothetical protein J6590_005176 [Homalodisca vitripennis]|nr:hypothetical protein J6590_005176 [Homalodisca vitripennis]
MKNRDRQLEIDMRSDQERFISNLFERTESTRTRSIESRSISLTRAKRLVSCPVSCMYVSGYCTLPFLRGHSFTRRIPAKRPYPDMEFTAGRPNRPNTKTGCARRYSVSGFAAKTTGRDLSRQGRTSPLTFLNVILAQQYPLHYTFKSTATTYKGRNLRSITHSEKSQ